MPRLTVTQQRFLVRSLASFVTASEVAKAAKDQFGLELAAGHIARYDPTNVAGADLSKDLKALFHATRKQFVEDVDSIPIAHRGYRLRRLQQIVDTNKSPSVIRATMEQAAKEMGGAFTNKTVSEVTVDGVLGIEVVRPTHGDGPGGDNAGAEAPP